MGSGYCGNPFCLFKLRGGSGYGKGSRTPTFSGICFSFPAAETKEDWVDTGLGDWCEDGERAEAAIRRLIEVTDTAISVHLLEEAGLLFRKLGMESGGPLCQEA